MNNAVNGPRRRFLGFASYGLGAAALAAGSRTIAATVTGTSDSTLGLMRRVRAGDLDIAYAEAGPASGVAVLLLHGWPYDIHAFVDVVPALAAAGFRVLVPYLRGYGGTRFLSASTPRNAQPAAVATDAINFLDALKINRVIVAGFDWGGRTANLMCFLWPERCRGLVSVSGYLVGSQQAIQRPLAPKAELPWWYLFYFATDRGKAGYAQNTKEFNRLIWQLASPRWAFTDAIFDRSAKAFENPDFVQITLHNYRWYLGLEKGEGRYDALERRIAAFPTIATPTITMEGDANGAPHADPSAYAKKYTGPYEHRTITGGTGHNLPQEAPQAFAAAVIELAKHVA
jgi:pimeloyl-ACP methyl ester carboxylesterase